MLTDSGVQVRHQIDFSGVGKWRRLLYHRLFYMIYFISNFFVIK